MGFNFPAQAVKHIWAATFATFIRQLLETKKRPKPEAVSPVRCVLKPSDPAREVRLGIKKKVLLSGARRVGYERPCP
jgi:hypothetical protein